MIEVFSTTKEALIRKATVSPWDGAEHGHPRMVRIQRGSDIGYRRTLLREKAPRSLIDALRKANTVSLLIAWKSTDST